MPKTAASNRPPPRHSTAAELRARYPRAERLFARHGWLLPERVTRVYDTSAAVEALGWRPRVTFEALLHVMEEAEAEEEKAPEDGARSKRRRATGGDLGLEDLLRGKY